MLEEQLSAAVREENYSAAARYKTQLSEGIKADTANTAQEELDSAIQEERYDDAAHIRDSTAVGLTGWWAGCTEDDPCGHLLHITKNFGRFTARAYTPSNLAEMKGWTEANPLRQNSQLVPDQPVNLGQRVMELYLHKNVDGKWEQQAVMLHDSAAVGMARDLAGNGDMEPMSLASVVKVLSTEDFQNAMSSIHEASEDEADHTIRTPATLLNITRNQFMVIPDGRESPPLTPPAGLNLGKPQLEAPSLTVSSGKDQAEFTLGVEVANSNGDVLFDEYTLSLKEEDKNDTWGRAADAVAEMQARICGDVPEVSRRQLADSIRSAIEELVEGCAEGGEGATLGIELSPEQMSIDQTALKPSTYSRLTDVKPTTDVLSGLYLGAFGPHGPEVLKVCRTVSHDGSTTVEGVKVTGDENVPAGQVSFRAKVGRQHKLANDGTYPEELGVTARYKGEGCVAQPGFTNPMWVEGELLVFSAPPPSMPGVSSVTGGAELGFVWSMPGEKKFLILMNRVDLNDLVQRSQF